MSTHLSAAGEDAPNPTSLGRLTSEYKAYRKRTVYIGGVKQ